MAFVEYELNDRIAVITMNRPERLNALGVEMGAELRAALKRFKEDDNDQLMDAAMKWAKKFLNLPPLHVRRTKALMATMRRIPDAKLIEAETAARAYLNELEDTREAAAAFAERRIANFTGR
ncbi:MAG: hypothetical protein ABIQ47_05885 [Tepidiformaceae bacterium]